MKTKNEKKTSDISSVVELKMNLYEKIQAVANKVKNIEKDMQVGSGSYSYKAVSDKAVTLAIKKAESEFRLVSIPIKQELVNSEVLRIVNNQGNESIKFIDNIKMTLKIIDLDDITQFVEVESYGKGVDTGDKGFGKASTYARKYALLNSYKIATGEDLDEDKSETINVPKTVSEKRVKINGYLDKNLDKSKQLLKYFNVEEIADLDDKQIDLVFKTYSDKGLL